MDFKEYLTEAAVKPKKFDKNKVFVFKLTQKLVRSGSINAEIIEHSVDTIKSLWKIDSVMKNFHEIEVTVENQASFNAFIKQLRADTGLKRADIVKYYKKPSTASDNKSVNLFKKTAADTFLKLKYNGFSDVTIDKPVSINYTIPADTNRYSVNYGRPATKMPAKLTTIQCFDSETNKYYILGFVELIGEPDKHKLKVISLDEPLPNIRPFLQDGNQGSQAFGSTDFWSTGQTPYVISVVEKERAKNGFVKFEPAKKIKHVPEEKSGKSAKDQDGNRVYIGDWIGWKADYEQSGKVIDIKRDYFVVMTSDSEHDGPEEEYVDFDRAWKE